MGGDRHFLMLKIGRLDGNFIREYSGFVGYFGTMNSGFIYYIWAYVMGFHCSLPGWLSLVILLGLYSYRVAIYMGYLL